MALANCLLSLSRSVRHQSGRDQSELAQSLGMSRATLSALESGRCREIGVSKLTVLVQAVGLDLYVAPAAGTDDRRRAASGTAR